MSSFKKKAPKPRAGKSHRRRGTAIRPDLERLEERKLPAVITVSSGLATDLVTAIHTANTNGDASNTIDLTGTYDLTAVDNYWYGPDGLPAITSNLTIAGDPTNGATIERDSGGSTPDFRLFYVSGGESGLTAGTLTLDNLSLSNGFAVGGASGNGGGGMGAGGAIFNMGNVTLHSVTVSGNNATGGSAGSTAGSGGGGIGGDSPSSGSGGGFGGVAPGATGGTGGTGTAITANDQYAASGGGFNAGDNGGSGNGTTSSAAAGGSGGLGGGSSTSDGGVAGQAYDINNPPGNTGNGGDFGAGGQAPDGGGGVGGGGGGGNPSTSFRGGDGGFGGGGGYGNNNGGDGGFGGGGAMGNSTAGNSGFGGGIGETGSSGSGGGGGGGGLGGAIFNFTGDLTIINSTIFGNTATGGAAARGFGGDGYGGGIFNLNGSVSLVNSTFDQNSVVVGHGATNGTGSMVTLDNGVSDGGDIFNLSYGRDWREGGSYTTGGPVTSTVTLANSILNDSNALVNVHDSSVNSGSGDSAVVNEVQNGGESTNFVASYNAESSSSTLDGGADSTSGDVTLAGSLANNAGTTETDALAHSNGLSPFSTGTTAFSSLLVPSVDQRGNDRASTPDVGAFELTVYTLTGIPSPLTAGTTETVTVTAINAGGNVHTEYNGTADITSTDSIATLPSTPVSFTDGVATFNATLKRVGTQSVLATDPNNSSITGSETGISVTPGATASFAVTGGTSETAGGVEAVTVTAEDAYGNLTTGYAGSVAITSSDGQAVLPGNSTLTNGVGNFNVTLKTAGSDSITATDTVSSGIHGTENGITVSPGSVSHLVVTGATSDTAGGVEAVTVTAKDQYGNTVPSYAGIVAITSSDGQAVLPGSSTLTNGVGNFNVTLKTAGSKSITATDTVASGINGTESGITVSPGSASYLVVTGGSAEIAGGVESVTVTAYDPYGNVATGYAGMVAITSSDAQAVLPGNSTLTNGVGNFNVTLKTAGSDSITATDTVSSGIHGTENGITVSPGSVSHLVVTGATSDTAGGVEAVTVTAKDQYGNTVPSYAGIVAITSSDGQAVLPGSSTLTNGVGTFNVTLKTAGSKSITATDTVSSAIHGTETGITVSPGSATHLVVTGGTDETAGGVENVTVTAEDQYGNVATAYTGIVAITSSDAQALLPGSSSLTNGVGTFEVALKTVGSESITATDTVSSAIHGTETGITVSPGSATHLVVTGATSDTAGGVETVTVTAEDQYGNVATGYTGIVAITSSDAQALLPGSSTLTNGVGNFSVTLKTAGTDSITATDTTSPVIMGTEAGLTISPAVASHLVLTGLSSPTVGGFATVTVTAYDAFGNIATSYAGTLQFTSSDAQAILPDNSGLANGVATFTIEFLTVGPQSITATDTINPAITGTDSGIDVGAAVASHLVVTGGTTTTAGGVETITVTAEDDYGNIVASYPGMVEITSSDSQSVLPADASLTNGVGTFEVTLRTAGADSITATDTVNPAITGTETGITITPASASRFVVTGQGSTVAGTVDEVSIIALDAFGNVATGYSGSVRLSSTDSLADLPSNAHLADGVLTVQVTLKTAGNQSITVTDSGNPGLSGTEVGVLVAPASASQFTIATDGTPGTEVSVTVTALDPYGNVATGYAGVLQFTSSDSQADLPSNVTLISGVGTFLVTFSATGVQSITVTDAGNGGLTDTQSISVTQSSSQAGSVVSSAPETFYGQNVVLTATFSATAAGGGAPMTGTVSFYDGSTFLGTVPVTTPNVVPFDLSGTVSIEVSLPTTALDVGNHIIRADYSGDVNYSPASSETPVAVEVQHTVTSTTLTATSTVQGTILDAKVVVTSPGDPSTAGTVTFFDGTTLLGTSTVSSGVATLNIGTLTAGSHAFSATFSGGGGSSASGSSATVSPASLLSGTVYLDNNANGSPDAGEPGLSGRVVFLDLQHDGTLDPGDPTATTDANGNFAFTVAATAGTAVLEATALDTIDRFVIDQTETNTDGTLDIGVVPYATVAPVPVVPNPFAGTPNPDPSYDFVQSLYQAVLGRTGSESETATWLVSLADGMTRAEVTEGFINSVEHRQDEVRGYYEEFLHRAPDPTSVVWVNELTSGVSEESVAGSILDSPEYQAEHQDSTAFVQDLYIDILGRTGGGLDVTGWVSDLASGVTRDQVVSEFVQSTEAVDQVVDGFYAAYLHRQPEPGTSDTWVNYLETPDGSASVVATDILASPEFDEDAVNRLG